LLTKDIPSIRPQTLIKADVSSRKCLTWSEKDYFVSEPVFVEKPDPKAEDDGTKVQI